MALKGQMMAAGLVLFGLSLIVLSFSVMEFSEPETQENIFEDVESSVPQQSKIISEEFSGKSFMHNFQIFSFRHRNPAAAVGNTVSYTVVLGEREDRDFNVYAGNFGNEEEELQIDVNGESYPFNLDSDTVEKTVFEPSKGYSVEVESDEFSESLTVYDNRFILVQYRYEGEGFVRQDTYTG